MNAGRGRPALIVTICAAVLLAAVGALAAPQPAQAAVGATSKYVPFGPARLVDTRNGPHPAVSTQPADNTEVRVKVAGVQGLPTTMTAVVLNVTVVNTTGSGYVQVFPTGQAAIGSSSNLNVTGPGQILSTLVVVPVGNNGQISVYQQRRADLVIDTFGYFTATTSSRAGRFHAVPNPARIVDSRTGVGLSGPGMLGTQDTRVVQVTGRGGVPTSGVNAVALNLTLTQTTASGYLTVSPNGQGSAVSNLNVERPGTTRANFAIVPVDGQGRVRLYTHTATHVIVDVVGWFSNSDAPMSSEGLYVPLTPGRVLDTRSGPRPGALATVSVPAGARLNLGSDVGALMTSITATEPVASGYVTAWPAGLPKPGTSNLNIEWPGQTIANAAIVGAPGGSFQLYTHQGSHLVADVAGYFRTAATPPTTPPPSNLLRWAYWGHLLADGRWDANNGTWTWNQTPYQLPESAARFVEAAAANGISVRRRDNGAYVTLTTPHPAAPDMRGRPNNEVRWFLAAVVEDEGDRCGLIADDPSREKLDYIGELLTQLGVTFRLTQGGGGFWSLRADASSFPEIQSWPYATTVRTPGLGTLPCQ